MKIKKSYLLKIIAEELEKLLQEQKIQNLAQGSARNVRYNKLNPGYSAQYDRVDQFGAGRRRNNRGRRRPSSGVNIRFGNARFGDRQPRRSSNFATDSNDTGSTRTSNPRDRRPPTPPYARGTMGGRRKDPNAFEPPVQDFKNAGPNSWSYNQALESGIIKKRWDDFEYDDYKGFRWQARAAIAQDELDRKERQKAREKEFKSRFGDDEFDQSRQYDTPGRDPDSKIVSPEVRAARTKEKIRKALKAEPGDVPSAETSKKRLAKSGAEIDQALKKKPLSSFSDKELEDTQSRFSTELDVFGGDPEGIEDEVEQIRKDKAKVDAELKSREVSIKKTTSNKTKAPMMSLPLQKGGTISKVAKMFPHVTTKQLLDYNNLSGDEARSLPVGYQVKIPPEPEEAPRDSV